MSLDRRNFIQRACTVIAGSAEPLSLAEPAFGFSRVETKAELGEMSWGALRSEFDELSTNQIHLSSFFLASHPRAVRTEIEKHRRGIDANPYIYIEKNIFEMPRRVQAAAAEYLGGRPDEVGLTNSTTMGLALVYQGLPLKPGDEIVTTAHDHFVHHESIRLAAERAGASVRKISLYDPFDSISQDQIVDRVKKAITEKTRVLGITWVHSGTGVKLPLRSIAEAVRQANRNRSESEKVLMIVDGVHGFGVEDEVIAETGVDIFISGTHKWIFGPRGTGIVWAKAETWKRLNMIFPAFSMEALSTWMMDRKFDEKMHTSWLSLGGFHSFEYEWALPAAFDLHKQIGRSRIADRIHTLNDQCKEGLARMKHVTLYTPRGSGLSAGLICFDVQGMKASDVVSRLFDKNIVASTAPYRNPYARLAPSLLNSPEEIETTLAEIRSMG